MKTLILFLAFLVCSISLSSAEILNATYLNGFETIFFDAPSYLTDVHFSNTTTGPAYFAYGEGTFKELTHGTVFQALDIVRVNPFPFVSSQLFLNQYGDIIAVGPAYRAITTTPPILGYFLPLAVSGPYSGNAYQGSYRDHTFYAVHVDDRNLSNIIAYFVGWAPVVADRTHVRLAVVRAHLNTTTNLNNANFTWSETNDVIALYTDDYHPYHTTFRPHIYQDIGRSLLHVWDPAKREVFNIYAPNDTSLPMEIRGAPGVPVAFGRPSGVIYSPEERVLYIGFAAEGLNPGTLVKYDLATLINVWAYNFPDGYSDPSALAHDPPNNILYIGFPESPQIIKLRLTDLQILGYQRVPYYLNHIYKGFDAAHDHVYFITHEQHSKAFRVSKSNFCTNACPYDGYCENGHCICARPFVLTSNGKLCAPPSVSSSQIQVEQGAAIAMGILFALVFVAGVLGWYKFYKARH